MLYICVNSGGADLKVPSIQRVGAAHNLWNKKQKLIRNELAESDAENTKIC